MASPPARSTGPRTGSVRKAAKAAAEDAGKRPLTAQERRFVEVTALAIGEGAELSGAEIARAAGYQGDDRTLRVTAARVRRRPAVRAAMMIRLQEVVSETLAPQALATLADLQRPGRKAEVRANVATRIAEGAGLLGQPTGKVSGGPQIAIRIELRHVDPNALAVQSAPWSPQVIDIAADNVD